MFGLAHNREQDNNPPFPYGSGHYVHLSGEGINERGFRTLMAYPKNGSKVDWPRRLYYSNPNVFDPEGGQPVGTELANNAKVLMMTRFKLSQLGNESSATCRDGKMLSADLDDNALYRLINDEEDEDEVEESNRDEE